MVLIVEKKCTFHHKLDIPKNLRVLRNSLFSDFSPFILLGKRNERMGDMSIGTRLRKLLEENKMTQTGLAKKLGISTSTLNGYITDYREPDIQMLSQLAKLLNTTTDYLITGDAPAVGTGPQYRRQVKVIAHNEGVTLM